MHGFYFKSLSLGKFIMHRQKEESAMKNQQWGILTHESSGGDNSDNWSKLKQVLSFCFSRKKSKGSKMEPNYSFQNGFPPPSIVH